MDAEHSIGGSMKVTLDRDDLARLRDGSSCEAYRATESDLFVSVVADNSPSVAEAEAMLFGRRLAIYLPGQCVSLGGLAAAAKNRVPLTEVLNDGITTMEDSPTRRDSLFGTIGSIVVTSALQVD